MRKRLSVSYSRGNTKDPSHHIVLEINNKSITPQMLKHLPRFHYEIWKGKLICILGFGDALDILLHMMPMYMLWALPLLKRPMVITDDAQQTTEDLTSSLWNLDTLTWYMIGELMKQHYIILSFRLNANFPRITKSKLQFPNWNE